MAVFVLVPGFWLGGWAWERVTPVLASAGHEVYPLTLTGLGDRVHLANPEVGLETHVTDIVNAITYANLDRVVLVAHSGGCMAVTEATDRIPERIARAIYVESAPFPDGMSQADVYPPELRERHQKQVADEGDGWRWPVPQWTDPRADPLLAGLTEDDLAVMRARAVPQPWRTATDPVHRKGVGPVPEALVVCTSPAEAARRMLAERHPRYAGFGTDVRVAELPTSHWPMFSRPNELAQVLLQLG